jgi:DNA polymerase III epsilon subunit-like protein
MAGVAGGMNEVILICAADYFTGAILLNKLVCPAEKVISWRSSIHGIKRSAMETAVLQRQALAGWKEARHELWKFIDDTTILVGHALQHDLEVLRMIHLALWIRQSLREMR